LGLTVLRNRGTPLGFLPEPAFLGRASTPESDTLPARAVALAQRRCNNLVHTFAARIHVTRNDYGHDQRRATAIRKPLRVSQLVDQLGLAGKRFAVERNGEIVPRSQLGASSIADGDRLEIVVAVGGG